MGKVLIDTVDLLIADGIARMVDNPSGILEKVVERFKLKRGGKMEIESYEEFQELSGMLNNVNINWTPGGSSANAFYNIGLLMPPDTIDLRFLGILGNDINSNMIMRDLNKGGIKLIPPSMEAGEIPQSATSIVIVFPDGERTIATYAGNAKQIITADRLPMEMFQQEALDSHTQRIRFKQGGAWKKFDDSVPGGKLGVADQLVTMAWSTQQELWLAMPTSAFFAKEHAGRFVFLVSSSQVVVGNGNEISNIVRTGQDEAKEIQKLEPFKETLEALMKLFKKGNNVVQNRETNGTRGQWGFVTFGKWGSAVVTKDGISYIRGHEVKAVNTLGAGDTAFGGFLAARLSGLGPKDCAEVAMALAGAKCRYNGPRLPDPLEALKTEAPEIANKLLEAQSKMFGAQDLINNNPGRIKT